MPKSRKRTNEEIIAAILNTGSIKGAAEALKLRVNTIYARMKTEEYQIAYDNAKRLIIEEASASLQAKTREAIDTIYNLMTDEATKPETRLSCAKVILEHTEKLENIARLNRRIEQLERESADIIEEWDL